MSVGESRENKATTFWVERATTSGATTLSVTIAYHESRGRPMNKNAERPEFQNVAISRAALHFLKPSRAEKTKHRQRAGQRGRR